MAAVACESPTESPRIPGDIKPQRLLLKLLGGSSFPYLVRTRVNVTLWTTGAILRPHREVEWGAKPGDITWHPESKLVGGGAYFSLLMWHPWKGTFNGIPGFSLPSNTAFPGNSSDGFVGKNKWGMIAHILLLSQEEENKKPNIIVVGLQIVGEKSFQETCSGPMQLMLGYESNSEVWYQKVLVPAKIRHVPSSFQLLALFVLVSSCFTL